MVAVEGVSFRYKNRSLWLCLNVKSVDRQLALEVVGREESNDTYAKGAVAISWKVTSVFAKYHYGLNYGTDTERTG